MEKGLNGKAVKIVILVMLFLSILIYFIIDFFDVTAPLQSEGVNSSNIFEELVLSEYDTFAKSSFYPISGNQGYFNVTKDGVKYFEENKTERASKSFNMIDPIVVTEGNIIAIFEHKGNNLYVFSSEGELYSKTTEYPILNVSINTIGYCAVISQNNDVYPTDVYNENGKSIKSGAVQNKNTFAITSDISNDGSLWALSVLDVNGVKINSQIFYISLLAENSLDFADSIVASNVKNPDEIITQLKFMDNDNIIIVSDLQIKSVNIKESFMEKWSIPLDNKLDHISFDGYKGFAIALGDGIINKDYENTNIVKYYDLNSNVIWEYAANSKITMLNARFQSAVFKSGHNINAIDNKGKLIWSYNPPADVRQAFFYHNTSNIIQVTDTKASIYNLGRSSSTPLTDIDESENDKNIDSQPEPTAINVDSHDSELPVEDSNIDIPTEDTDIDARDNENLPIDINPISTES